VAAASAARSPAGSVVVSAGWSATGSDRAGVLRRTCSLPRISRCQRCRLLAQQWSIESIQVLAQPWFVVVTEDPLGRGPAGGGEITRVSIVAGDRLLHRGRVGQQVALG